MSVDNTKLILSSKLSYLKVVQQGNGAITSINLPSSGQTQNTITIPHNIGNDNIIFQIGASQSGNNYILPWNSNDSRTCLWASIDSNNLYVTVETNDSSGYGYPASTWDYYYRIMIP